MQRPATKGTVLSTAIVAAAVAFAWGLKSIGANVSIQVLTLALAVVAASGLSGRVAGFAASVATVLAYNLFFTEPLYTLLVDDPQNYGIFALLLAAGILVGGMNERLETLARRQLEQEREIRAATFLQGVSHDLRTPVSALRGHVEGLRASARSKGNFDDLDRLNDVEHELRGLTRQIDNALTLTEYAAKAQVDRGVLIPAEEALYSCRDRFRAWKPDRRVDVDVGNDVPLIRVDPALLEQALLNLIENADRYSLADASVELAAVTGSVRGSSFVELCVRDRGPGIPDDSKNRVFEKFERLDRPSFDGTRRGTGLGLAIVFQCARVLGGSCGVRDREGGGSEFWIRLLQEQV